MDWCTVEWPPRPRPNLNTRRQKQQSGKKAATAGLLGLGMVIILVGVVLGYAVWSKKLTIPATFSDTGELLREFISGQIPVTVTVDGETRHLQIKGKTVQDVLTQQGIKLKPRDQVLPSLSTPVKRNMSIKVIRVEEKEEIKQAAVPFPSKQTPRTRTVISRGGQQLRFTRTMEMTATGYTYTGNNTASGVKPGPGVAAVDPRVIPLGTRLYIDGYGNAVALDTGSLIKGNRIDLFYETEAQAIKWGVRKTKVYVLE